nr:MAG TPA: hypothetical protein [Caudoviricetes sp.]
MVVQLSRLMMVNLYSMMTIPQRMILYIINIMMSLMNGYLTTQNVDTLLIITRIDVDT